MRKPRPSGEQDHPTIAEVRRWRAKMVRDAGGTLDGLIAMLRRSQATDAKRKRQAKTRRKPVDPSAPRRRKAG